jgi:hypothetical protein
VKPHDFARFTRLLVQDGEGATEPVLYTAREKGGQTLIFQYVFQNGGPPGQAAIEDAIFCWVHPDARRCADAGD